MNEHTFKTNEKFARIECVECGPQFLTTQQYDQQMENPHKGWRCPQCHCYPCYWDDDYFELPLK